MSPLTCAKTQHSYPGGLRCRATFSQQSRVRPLSSRTFCGHLHMKSRCVASSIATTSSIQTMNCFRHSTVAPPSTIFATTGHCCVIDSSAAPAGCTSTTGKHKAQLLPRLQLRLQPRLAWRSPWLVHRWLQSAQQLRGREATHCLLRRLRGGL